VADQTDLIVPGVGVEQGVCKSLGPALDGDREGDRVDPDRVADDEQDYLVFSPRSGL
jgi:hypothetical protein